MAAKRKVLYLITKSNWGGAQRYVYDLATHLDPNKFDVVVACGGNGTLVELLTHAGIRTVTLDALTRDVTIGQDRRFMSELWQLLRQEKPDILHVNSSKAGGVGALLGRLTRTPRIVFTAHGWAFNEDRPWWQRVLIKALHWLTVILSHRTIAVSHAIVQEMNWPGAQRKMKVLHPGRSIGPMYTRSEAREQLIQFFPQLNPFANDPWVACIAELHPIKRHQILFAAVDQVRQKLPKLRLLCIGDGQQREALQTYVKEHNLEEHVFILGPVTEAARFLRGFDSFTLASKSESYGYVLHEAGLAKLPVVATNVGGIRDIITHEQTGLLVPPNDSETLAAALLRIHHNKADAQRMAESLHTTMKHRTTEKMAEATAALYTL